MPTLHLLGTGAGFSGPERTTTMLAFADGPSTLVVDCGGDVVQRLLAAGIDLRTITALIVTHEHPDHVAGFPLFMEKIWLAGRREPIPVYGIEQALSQARRCFETFDTKGWKGLPEIQWHPVPLEEGALVLEDAVWRVEAAPGVHAVPVVGVRVEAKRGGVAAYSCDTEPTPGMATLGREADLFVHEATGEGPGHASAVQAAEIALRARSRRLLLVHLPPAPDEDELQRARALFPAVEWGDELGHYGF